GGENYLIPVDASIPGEAYLRDRSVSMQAVLDELNAARNTLNIVVLDACRDNPFSWRRSASRGLQVVSNQPADSIIVYATSAGSAAADGEGRNGLFTTHLLNNLQKPDLEVNEVFRLTGADVRRASGGMQIPAIYSQFFDVAYLGNRPAVVTPAPGPRPPVVNPRLAPASQPTSTPQQPQTGNATYNASRTGAYIAHSSLALNTRVKVTNLANGLSAEAVVTGRIAINPDRIADISGELGDILRMSRTGVTRVQIEELPSPAQGTRR
ncbi:MAG: caspase family protein, partial [Treponema sp.]|nr:caspase family protein [Treponema sp.]